MTALLADNNAEGNLRAVLRICESTGWMDVWQALGVTVHTFKTARIDPAVLDDELWDWCQRTGAYLFTANRNAHGLHSLQQAIVARSTAQSVPVLSLSNPDRVLADRNYAEDVAVRLMEIIMEPERFRGSGRLWLP
jgi:hypothetical protein